MKLFIKFRKTMNGITTHWTFLKHGWILTLLLYHSLSYANGYPPIIISYEDSGIDAQIYHDILIEKHHIPDELIRTRQVIKCQNIEKEGKLNFCIKKEGDILIISLDKLFINESLKVFKSNEH